MEIHVIEVGHSPLKTDTQMRPKTQKRSTTHEDRENMYHNLRHSEFFHRKEKHRSNMDV